MQRLFGTLDAIPWLDALPCSISICNPLKMASKANYPCSASVCNSFKMASTKAKTGEIKNLMVFRYRAVTFAWDFRAVAFDWDYRAVIFYGKGLFTQHTPAIPPHSLISPGSQAALKDGAKTCKQAKTGTNSLLCLSVCLYFRVQILFQLCSYISS